MFVLAVGFLAHLSACLFFYCALLTYFITDSWDGTWVANRGLTDAGLDAQYVNSIYWAFTTVATGEWKLAPKAPPAIGARAAVPPRSPWQEAGQQRQQESIGWCAA